MTEEEYRAEQAEAERLRNRINEVISQINYINHENAQLEVELQVAIDNVGILISNCAQMDREVVAEMGRLASVVGEADVSTKEVFQALTELTTQYFSFKSISTASKNLTQFTDEYHTRFHYYNELRRIALGYVVGLDSNIINSETMRKKVEKAYLQNTEYWLAYCIAAVMLWSSKEKEAAYRALAKSLSINYFNSCLFYLLINLRFNRIDAAKKWYINYLDRADMTDLGDEWQYLLQAYLFGAFGADEEFQTLVSRCFRNMLTQVEVTTVDFAKKFTRKALEFAQLYVHRTNSEYVTLGRTCAEYSEMLTLLSDAEKNAEIAKYFNSLSEAEMDEVSELPQRIENVLYSLISNYDDEELELVRKIKLNEEIIAAKGDYTLAQAKCDAAFEDSKKKKNLGDLMLTWAFADDTAQTDVSVKKFAISLMKEAIAKGFEQYVEEYSKREKEKYTFNIDECIIECDEDGYTSAQEQLEKFYNKNKFSNTMNDKQVLIYCAVCAVSLLLLLILFAYFSPVILTIGILLGLAGSFLLWRRIVDMGKILQEKKRKGKLLLKRALDELKQWRTAYKEADAKKADLFSAIESFN